MSKADLINLVERGESSFLEFKQKVASPEKLAREIAAFANSEGGIILVGIGDKGELIGLETYLEEEFWLKQAAEQECLPPVKIKLELFQMGQKDILIVRVPEAPDKPVQVKAGKSSKIRKVFVRVDDASVEASDEYIQVLKQDRATKVLLLNMEKKSKFYFAIWKSTGYHGVRFFQYCTLIVTEQLNIGEFSKCRILNLYDKDGKPITHFR